MREHEGNTHRRFYHRTIRKIHDTLNVPEDLCFVYVQHAFSPCINHLSCTGDRLAAIIPKGSSSRGNPDVVRTLNELFPGKVLSEVTRHHLTDASYAVQLLKDVTKGRPFAILEYGGYFAPSAVRIATDRYLGPKLVGFVEGTENGIKGSDDGLTPGYQQFASDIPCPVVSKSKSNIKRIMDLEIGPAIVESSDNLLRRSCGSRLQHWRGTIGVIGLGSIGRGVLQFLRKYNCTPLVYDADPSVMAELAYQQNNIVSQRAILTQSDILFLNTGSCFLSQQPDLLSHLKENVILILCTSGEVEAGIPQLIEAGDLKHITSESSDDIAIYQTRSGKNVRVMLGNDHTGQAPNMIVEDGSGSPANLMSDMEFYALGAYLASAQNTLPANTISTSPAELQNLVLTEWLQEFYPASVDENPATGHSQISTLTPQPTENGTSASLAEIDTQQKQVV